VAAAICFDDNPLPATATVASPPITRNPGTRWRSSRIVSVASRAIAERLPSVASAVNGITINNWAACAEDRGLARSGRSASQNPPIAATPPAPASAITERRVDVLETGTPGTSGGACSIRR